MAISPTAPNLGPKATQNLTNRDSGDDNDNDAVFLDVLPAAQGPEKREADSGDNDDAYVYALLRKGPEKRDADSMVSYHCNLFNSQSANEDEIVNGITAIVNYGAASVHLDKGPAACKSLWCNQQLNDIEICNDNPHPIDVSTGKSLLADLERLGHYCIDLAADTVNGQLFTQGNYNFIMGKASSCTGSWSTGQ